MLVPLSVLLVASTPWDTPNNTLFHTSTYVPKTYISPFRNPHMSSLLCVWKPYVIASTFHPGMCAWPVMMSTPSGACRYTADLLTYGALMKLWRLGSLYVCTYCMYTTTLPSASTVVAHFCSVVVPVSDFPLLSLVTWVS